MGSVSPRSEVRDNFSTKGSIASLFPSPTVTSTLRSLSHVYREQGHLETANQLDQLTKEEARDKARVAQVLACSDPPPAATLTVCIIWKGDVCVCVSPVFVYVCWFDGCFCLFCSFRGFLAGFLLQGPLYQTTSESCLVSVLEN